MAFQIPWDSLFISLQCGTGAYPGLGIDYVKASAPSTCIPLQHANMFMEIEQKMNQHGIAGVVWNCARALIDCLQHESHFLSDKRVLELGAGPGAVGLALAQDTNLQAVVLTDLEAVVPFTKHNMNAVAQQHRRISEMLKSGRLSTIAHCWGSGLCPMLEKFNADIVLCSDCLYEPMLYPHLLASLVELTKNVRSPSQLVILAYKRRFPQREKKFFDAASEFFEIALYSKDDKYLPTEYFDEGIFICKMERRQESKT